VHTDPSNSTRTRPGAHGRRSPGRQRHDRLRRVRDAPQQTTLERGENQRPPQRHHRGVETFTTAITSTAISTAITSTAIYVRTTITTTSSSGRYRADRSPGRYRADRPSLDQVQCPRRAGGSLRQAPAMELSRDRSRPSARAPVHRRWAALVPPQSRL